MEKEDQIEVIKFLKSAEYQTTLRKYENKYINKYNKFEEKYFSAAYYTSNEPEYSENAMQSRKYKIFKERIDDVKWISRGAELVRELLEEQAKNIKSHAMNSVTNSFGWSKDVAVFTEDDLFKFEMLHEKDFHIFIIWIMNPGDEMDMDDKYSIYEDPEEQLV